MQFMKLNKQAQLSLFIVLGIVIAVTVVLISNMNNILVSSNKQKTNPLGISATVQLKEYVTSCMKNSAQNAVSLIEINGGLLNPPSNIKRVYVSNDFGVNVIYDKGNLLLPTINDLQEQMSTSVNNDVEECLKEFQGEDKGYSFSWDSDPVSNIKILPHKILITTYVPIQITKDGSTAELENFQTSINSELYGEYENALGITYELFSSDYDQSTYLRKLLNPYINTATDYSMDFIFYKPSLVTKYWIYNSDTTIWFIYNTDNEIKAKNEIPSFIFATKQIENWQ